jgi:hypothetical protein
MTRTKIGGRAALAVVCAVLLFPACGKDSPTNVPPPTLPPAPPPAPRVVAEGAGSIPVDEVGFVQFTTDATGRLEVTVDWTFAANDIDIFLVRGSCTEDQIIAGSCPFLAFSTSVTAKPERLSVPGATAGQYTLYAANFGPGDESASFQAVLTPAAADVAAGLQAGAPGRATLKARVSGMRELR